MFRFILVSVLIAFSTATPKVRNPHPQLDGRILGGVEININEAPHQLSLQYHGSHICGASLITARFAVTAAHCTDGAKAQDLSVRAGSSRHNSGGQIVGVADFYQHEKYSEYDYDYDISVLKLVSDAFKASSIALALFEPTAGAKATCTGWGTYEGGFFSANLRSVTVPIVSRADCNAIYGSGSVTDRMICAGLTEGGKDACQGDSGGPLVSGGKLVGIISWGYGCARPNYPRVYTNIANLATFINDNTKM